MKHPAHADVDEQFLPGDSCQLTGESEGCPGCEFASAARSDGPGRWLLADALTAVAKGAPRGADIGLAISSPFDRDGFSPQALIAIGYLEGLADAVDLTVLELLDTVDVRIPANKRHRKS